VETYGFKASIYGKFIIPFTKGNVLYKLRKTFSSSKYWLGKKNIAISGNNHYLFGISQPVEVRNKISNTLKGNKNGSGKRTEAQRIRISEGHKGQVPWNKGTKIIKNCLDCNAITNGIRCRKCAMSLVAIKNKGTKRSIETREILRESHLGQVAWNKGKGKGRVKYIYPSIFANEIFRNKLKQIDNYTCQGCDITEEEHITVFGYILSLHHINYIKANCSEDNLITVCHACNARANYNKTEWIKFYQDKLKPHAMGSL
jgi:hypothetical protein